VGWPSGRTGLRPAADDITGVGEASDTSVSLSGDQKLSCATRHQPDLTWSDGLGLTSIHSW
jgi:hypothetical protein